MYVWVGGWVGGWVGKCVYNATDARSLLSARIARALYCSMRTRTMSEKRTTKMRKSIRKECLVINVLDINNVTTARMRDKVRRREIWCE